MNEIFMVIFIIAIIIYYVISYWLDHRQKQAVKASYTQVPEQFREKISLKQHQKAADYTMAKLGFGGKEMLLSLILLLAWTLGGGLQLLDNFWQQFALSPIWTGVGFMLSFMLVSSILDIPASLYKTFKLEAQFGFNKITKKLFVSDLFKNLLLSIVLGVPLLYLILYLMNSTGEFWWLFVWLTLVIISLLTLWIYPSYIAPLFNKFTPLADKELAHKITQLLTKTGFSSDGVFVMDGSKRSSHGNAYFTGLGKQKRIVFFDTLLKGLSHQEVLAVLGHELGHFSHKHIRTQMISSFGLMLALLTILGFLIDKSWFYQGLGVSTQSNYIALTLFLLILPVFTTLIQPLQNILSRKHEYEADTFAAKHTNADDLVSALVGLYRDNASTLTPDSYYSLFYDSHPRATLRINHLKGQI